ncbi:MAG: FAD-binding oxidoreductase [Oscillospiraceae bacterium]
MADGAVFETTVDAWLRDESVLQGFADGIARPATIEAACAAVRHCAEHHLPLTVQGARTGLCGGAVPLGGHILNLEGLTAVSGFSFDAAAQTGTITVQAGLTLKQLQTILEKKQLDTGCMDAESIENWRAYVNSGAELCFAPNPTEQNATLGGVAACNAAGAHRCFLSSVAQCVSAAAVITPAGTLAHHSRADGAIGHLCGAEGSTGAIVQLTLLLESAPKATCGLCAFFPGHAEMVDFLHQLEQQLPDAVQLRGAECFDGACLAAVQAAQLPTAAQWPAFPPGTRAALWLRLAGESEDALFDALEAAYGALEGFGAAETALAATSHTDLERLGSMRHTATEAANLLDTQGLIVDAVAPKAAYAGLLGGIAEDLERAGLPAVLMGDAACRALHLRILPQAGQEAAAAEYLNTLGPRLQGAGCRCGPEHGIGRLKKELFALLSAEEAADARRRRDAADPERRFNAGVLA